MPQDAALPSDMLFIESTGGGGPEVLRPARMPVPEPGPGEVLVEVHAAGVNRPDVLQRSGNYPPPPGASNVLGLEIAGTIVKLGDGVSGDRLGEPVCALVHSGGYAEYCVASAPLCLPVPKGFSMIEAAALPETYFTVWTNVFERGGLVAGETILIHGGSSGIGTTAIQLAKVKGAHVIVTVGSAAKALACKEFGADHAIDYKTEDFVARVKAITKNGVDLILCMVGGSYIQRNFQALKVEGRLVQIAFLGGAKAEVDFTALMIKRLTFTGSTLRPRTVAQKTSIAEALRAEVWPLLAHGSVRPVISRVLPLAEAAKAHALMEESRHIGKIMLDVRGGRAA